MPDADASRAARAEVAFRRAAELDPAWAQPKAGLGTLLLKQGRKEEALAQFRAALLLDPACAEAQQGMAQARPGRARRDYRIVLSAALGAVAAAGVLLLLRPAARATPATPVPRRLARAEPHAPAPPANDLQPAPALPLARDPAPNPGRAAPALAPDPTPNPARAPALALARDSTPNPAPDPERARAPALASDPAREPEAAREPAPAPVPARDRAPAPPQNLHSRRAAVHTAAESRAAKGDQALRAFDTRSAQSAFESALKLDPTLPSAHRGMGMVYVLQGKNAEAKSEYAKYLRLAPDAPDKDQIERLLSR
jgi:peptidoglycan DL-endopeptidase CwlO